MILTPNGNISRKKFADKLDIEQCFTNQKPADIDHIIKSVCFLTIKPGA